MKEIYNLYQDTLDVNLQHAGSFSSLEKAQNAAGFKGDWIKENDSTWRCRRLLIKKVPIDEFVLA